MAKSERQQKPATLRHQFNEKGKKISLVLRRILARVASLSLDSRLASRLQDRSVTLSGDLDMLEQPDGRGAYRTERQVQTRGRWATGRSVLRYSKTHVYLGALAAVPEHVRNLGVARSRAVGNRPAVARE